MSRSTIAILIFFISSCSAIGNRNIEKLKGVYIGMTAREVYKIMGNPDWEVKYESDSGFYRLIYKGPFLSPDNISICLDEKDSLVVKIMDGQE